jgi:DNA-binding NtrC family response regulator
MSPKTSNDSICLLFVDDDKNQHIIFKKSLQTIDPNIIVETTTSPENAKKLLKSKKYDCIVSDLKFPKINGIQFLQEVKALYTIPFILYSGQLTEETIDLAFSENADDYIQKEVGRWNFKILMNRIIRLVENYRLKEVKSNHTFTKKTNNLESNDPETYEIIKNLDHDIRGALGNIVGAVDLIIMEPDTTNEMLKIIKKSANEIIEKVKNIRKKFVNT